MGGPGSGRRKKGTQAGTPALTKVDIETQIFRRIRDFIGEMRQCPIHKEVITLFCQALWGIRGDEVGLRVLIGALAQEVWPWTKSEKRKAA